MSNNTDTKFMSLAIRLAEKALGMTSPNPAVGAVITKNNKIIGKGYHKKAGLPHAEIEAINDAKKNVKSLKGSTLYVTLEPCCHKNKKTPPCVDAVLREEFARIVIGTLDRNPHVKGKSLKKLRQKNIEVVTGILENECYKLNESFFKFITRGIPFVTLKLAATLDGKISTYTGDSKWIGTEKQREYAHRLRFENDAVIVGINTVITDNPMLNVRTIKTGKQPLAVVLDTKFRIPIDSNLIRKRNGTMVFVSEKIKKPLKKKKFENSGAVILGVKLDNSGEINLGEALKRLGTIGITSVLVEGGSKLASGFLKHHLVDKVIFFYSPKILGADGKSMVGELGITSIKKSIQLNDVNIKTFDGEIMLTGYI